MNKFIMGATQLKFDGGNFPILDKTNEIITEHNMVVSRIQDNFTEAVRLLEVGAREAYMKLCEETKRKLEEQ